MHVRDYMHVETTYGDREGPAYASNVPSALDIDTDA